MDRTLLDIYLENSCFELEQETDSAIVISERNNKKVNDEDRIDFWKNLVKIIDYEPLSIDLFRPINSTKNDIYKFFCVLRIPKVVRNKKTNYHYIKAFISLKLINEFKFVNDNLSNTIESLSDFQCVFSKERAFNDFVDNKYLTVNFCIYIPIKCINKLIILK